MAFGKLRFATVVGLAALTGGATLVVGQNSVAEVGEEAMRVAMEAEDEIRAIDPTTGGDSLVFDSSLPQPYGPSEETLPELPSAPTELTEAVLEDAPRGPAARMIGAQDANLPELPAAPAEITARALEQAPVVAAPQPAPAVAPPAPAPAIAQAPEDPFVINSILPIEGTIRYGEWFWDESRAPAKGKLVITVDLDARVISVFRDGHEIGTAVALLGTKSHPTPV
ncbi:MAG: L,D-transpeptidase, partial [Pseudomonadota bacterium]